MDWQDRYHLAKPLSLPAGTKLYAEIIYDNSADNPENPYSPPQRIKWGRESNDEIGAVTLQVVAKDEADRPELQRAVSESLTDAVRKSLPDSLTNRLRGLGGQGRNSPLLKLLEERILDADAIGDEMIDADESQTARQQLEGRRR